MRMPHAMVDRLSAIAHIVCNASKTTVGPQGGVPKYIDLVAMKMALWFAFVSRNFWWLNFDQHLVKSHISNTARGSEVAKDKTLVGLKREIHLM